ncbi:hypothetical protein V5O48_004969 [Marasmius crinis-equi]|uniref:Smr domain-containing protein n=1 Tax=Marasmius crinis-equi TaxID=585013 RepID=A0ABR3FNM7_9AGAR
MDILVSTASSFVLRYVLSNALPSYKPSMIIPVFLGIWEGTWLHMLLLSMPSSYDPYLAYLLRPFIDFFISGSISYVFSVVVWSALTVLALDAMGPAHFHDTRREKTYKRPISTRTGSAHTSHTVLHPIPHTPRSRRSRSRSLTFVLPVSSPESANLITSPPSQEQSQASTSQSSSEATSGASSSATPQIPSSSSSATPQIASSSSTSTATPPRTELTPQQRPIPPIESSEVSAASPEVDLGNNFVPSMGLEPVTSPITSIPLLNPPVNPRIELVVPAVAEGSRSNFPRSPFPPSTAPPIVATSPTAPEESRIAGPARDSSDSPIPVPAPGFFPGIVPEPNPRAFSIPPQPPVRAFLQHHDETDALQTPVLRGFDDQVQVDSDIEADELTTPPHLRAVVRPHHPSFMQALEGSLVEEPPTAGPSLLLDARSVTLASSTSITANVSPVPVPPRGQPSPALSALDMLSPVSATSAMESIISTTDPKLLFDRAEKLRNKAWKEVEEKARLKADLVKARAEGRKKDIFILTGDIKDSEHRIDNLHARAKRRYYLAKNTEALQGDEIDVHGLLVEEAVEATEVAFRKILREGKDTLRVIVGKGNHSKDGTPKLKPAVTTAMKKHGFQCTVDPRNAGVLLLAL